MTSQTDQSLSRAPSAKAELRDWLQSEHFKRDLAATLPKFMEPDKFIKIAFQATFRQPKLLSCTKESFFNCLLQLAAMGLEPDGRRAHLIPYKDVCTLIVDWKGIAELLRRNKDVVAMHADVVGLNDHFEVRFGTRGILDHEPNLRDRGEIYCAYSWVRLPDGTEEYDVMNKEEIESIRKRSKSANDGPWVTDTYEMWKKTVFRRHSKRLPLSPQTRDALERETDGDALTEQERFAHATPVVSASVMGGFPRRRGRPPKSEQDTPATMPLERAESPQEPSEGSEGSDVPAGAPETPKTDLHIQVEELLEQSDFSQAELLGLLKKVRLAQPEVQTLKQCTPHALSYCLGNWNSALGRMREARAQAAPEQPLNQDKLL